MDRSKTVEVEKLVSFMIDKDVFASIGIHGCDEKDVRRFKKFAEVTDLGNSISYTLHVGEVEIHVFVEKKAK